MLSDSEGWTFFLYSDLGFHSKHRETVEGSRAKRGYRKEGGKRWIRAASAGIIRQSHDKDYLTAAGGRPGSRSRTDLGRVASVQVRRVAL